MIGTLTDGSASRDTPNGRLLGSSLPVPGAADVIAWSGATVVSSDGHRVGSAGGLVVDRQTGAPHWMLVHTRSQGSRCVPLGGLQRGTDRIHVPHETRTIMDSPPVPADGALTARHEVALAAAYGMPMPSADRSRWERRRLAALAWTTTTGEIRWSPPPRDPEPVLEATAVSAPILRVLIADPDLDTVGPLRTAVSHHARLQLSSAHRDGPQAMTAAWAQEPDVLVLAAHMPLVDGLEVRDRVHAMLPHAVTVIVDDTLAVDTGAEVLDARTVRVPKGLTPAHLIRVAEVLALAEDSRSELQPYAQELLTGEHPQARQPLEPV